MHFTIAFWRQTVGAGPAEREEVLLGRDALISLRDLKAFLLRKRNFSVVLPESAKHSKRQSFATSFRLKFSLLRQRKATRVESCERAINFTLIRHLTSTSSINFLLEVVSGSPRREKKFCLSISSMKSSNVSK